MLISMWHHILGPVLHEMTKHHPSVYQLIILSMTYPLVKENPPYEALPAVYLHSQSFSLPPEQMSGSGVPGNQPAPEYTSGSSSVGYLQPGYSQPIAKQPIGSVLQEPSSWMGLPPGNSNIPYGLEYLSQVDQLLINQQIELLEVLTGFETKNKFVIRNSLGQNVYYAIEESDCLVRNCCGPIRPMGIKVFDNFRNEVIYMDRPLACGSCCYPCCLQSIEISSSGAVIGRVEQEWSIWIPHFKVKNAAGDTVLRIQGPCCTMSCGGDVKFKVLSVDRTTEIGSITKQWSGFVREAFTDCDNFGITFPVDLDVKIKAVLLGATFLIDMMFFERTNNK